MRINLYRFGIDLEVVEKGQCEIGAALAILDDCHGRDLHSFKSLEEAMSATSFGLSKSEDDFIEVSCDGNGIVSIHTDRLHYPSRISKMLGLKRHFYIQGTIGRAQDVIRDYYHMERLELEEKYAGFLCR